MRSHFEPLVEKSAELLKGAWKKSGDLYVIAEDRPQQHSSRTLYEAVSCVNSRSGTFKIIQDKLSYEDEPVSMEEGFNAIENILREKYGYNEFSFLDQGGIGIVITATKPDGNTHVLRFTFAPGTIHTTKLNIVRSEAPHMLQGQHMTFLNGVVHASRMSIVPVFNVGALGKAFPIWDAKLTEIYRETCFEHCADNKGEITVLPGGEFLYFDPGDLPYHDNFYDLPGEEKPGVIAESIKLVYERLHEMSAPEILIPIKPDGQGGFTYKQHDYLFLPQRQEFILT